MVFNSIHFVVFFAVVYGSTGCCRIARRTCALLAASYCFYAAWDWRFTGCWRRRRVVSYWAAAALGRPAGGHPREAAARVVGQRSASSSPCSASSSTPASSPTQPRARCRPFGFDVGDPVLAIVLPLGISFYTFMAMATSIDVYRGDMAPVDAPPDRLRGVRRLLPAPRGRPDPARAGADAAVRGAAHDPPRADRQTGAWLVATGLFKKIVVADNLSPTVERRVRAGTSPGALDVIVGVYAFALQIYGDFSGYTDMARGISQLLGIELNRQLPLPLLGDAIPREFWRHWHISLSTWLRDYLYMPLGGNRGSRRGRPTAT